MDTRPLCIDLFCGRGGWARGFLDAGYRVVGFDIEDMSRWYPGEFVRGDVSRLDGTRFKGARVVTCSDPCDPFVKLPWFKRSGDTTLYEAGMRVIDAASPEFWIRENVQGAQDFQGPAVCHRGSRYLWGNFPIFSMSRPYGKWRLPPSPDRKAIRSLIPYSVSRALAEACKP